MRKDTPKYLSTAEVGDPEKYITRLGRFLRRSSIDELPQLINVLKGDMSLVGPRPLIADEYEIHAMRLKYGVYAIRPGMTGLAQINGRDTVCPAEKVKWDVRYLQHFGFPMDAGYRAVCGADGQEVHGFLRLSSPRRRAGHAHAGALTIRSDGFPEGIRGSSKNT